MEYENMNTALIKAINDTLLRFDITAYVSTEFNDAAANGSPQIAANYSASQTVDDVFLEASYFFMVKGSTRKIAEDLAYELAYKLRTHQIYPFKKWTIEALPTKMESSEPNAHIRYFTMEALVSPKNNQ